MAEAIREREAIRRSMREVLDHYNHLRGKHIGKDHLFWDAVVLSAADEEQQRAFELQIEAKMTSKEVPLGVPFHVVSDPPGNKIGNGGSTLHVLEQLYEKLGEEMFHLRLLVLHAGGSSQRLPTASVLGKLFTPLPLGEPPYQMLDLKLAIYLPFLRRMQPGICIACADDVETYCLSSLKGATVGDWSFGGPGFVALAQRGSLETGEHHGVYVLPELKLDPDTVVSSTPCLEVLQKPSRALMMEKGAIIQGFGVCTDSIFYFSHDVTRKLLELYKSIVPLTWEIDAYRDFLQALGTRSSEEYIKDKNVDGDCRQREVQRQLFHLLHRLPLTVVLLHQSNFFHLGTCMEYLEHLTLHGKSMFVDFNLIPLMASKVVGGNPSGASDVPKDHSVTIMHSLFGSLPSCSGPTIFEYCDFGCPIVVGRYCLLSNCCCSSEELVVVPPSTMIHTVPVKRNDRLRFVTVAFGIDDDLKKTVSRNDYLSLRYFGQTLRNSTLNDVSSESLFDAEIKDCSLWNIKLFSTADNMNDSFLKTLKFLTSFREPTPQDVSTGTEDVPDEKLSMADILRHKDTTQMLLFRELLRKKIDRY